MSIDLTFHYPPDLLKLLINTIPLLNPSKKDVFLFFQGAGVAAPLMAEPYRAWEKDKESINKYEIVRAILTALNEKGEQCLRERREVLKRVVEFENFTVCWPDDQLKAKGLVADIRSLINVKDSFTRMSQEREQERQERVNKERAEKEVLLKKKENIEKVKQELFALFPMKDVHKRGKALEGVLNGLFKAYGISVKEAFTLAGDSDEGIIEQIDGVVEIDSHIYFVEMKWWQLPLGVAEVSQHLVRVYHRAMSRAIIISASSYTEPAITTCKEALQQKVVVLCTLQEIVMLLEKQSDLKEFFRRKVQAAITDKNPFCCTQEKL